MTIAARAGTSGTVFEVSGSFDPEEVGRLHELLIGLGPETPVTLDFREVRLFHDSAIAPLAQEIGAANRPVLLFGLSEHHHRLLRYVGFKVNRRAPGKAAHAS